MGCLSEFGVNKLPGETTKDLNSKKSLSSRSPLFCVFLLFFPREHAKFILFGVDQTVVSQKGGFGGCFRGTKTGTRVHSDVPLERKPERGYVRMFPQNEKWNEGTFTKTTLLRNRPFLSPSEISLIPHCRELANESVNIWFGMPGRVLELESIIFLPIPEVFYQKSFSSDHVHKEGG